MGPGDLRSLVKFLFSVWRRIKLELLVEEDKHNFISTEAMTTSIKVSLWIPRPMA